MADGKRPREPSEVESILLNQDATKVYLLDTFLRRLAVLDKLQFKSDSDLAAYLLEGELKTLIPAPRTTH